MILAAPIFQTKPLPNTPKKILCTHYAGARGHQYAYLEFGATLFWVLSAKSSSTRTQYEPKPTTPRDPSMQMYLHWGLKSVNVTHIGLFGYLYTPINSKCPFHVPFDSPLSLGYLDP